MKSKVSFVCQECGYDSPQWLGKCPECNTWNSLREFQVRSKINPSTSLRRISKMGKGGGKGDAEPKTLSEIEPTQNWRLSTGFSEMDGVLGGGVVSGSVILLAGDPGVGKSTLLLQLALNLGSPHLLNDSSKPSGNTRFVDAKGSDSTAARLANSYSKITVKSSFSREARPDFNSAVLYISGEESAEQVKLRASRIYPDYKKVKNFSILSSTNTDLVSSSIEEAKPSLVIIDSIQTMESESMGGLSGSVGQVRYAASQFIKTAKTLNIPIFIVGHVTKEGMVAGPMVLSHMVDTLLFLEGEKITNTRILRSLKNRYGPVDEVGIFTMDQGGIKQADPSQQFFLTKNLPKNVNGSVISVTIEGSRVFLVEIQGLVVSSKMPIPRRVASGVDYKRLELLLAILQKHCNLPVNAMDVFVNVAGGLKLSDPAADLGICLAIFSSFKNISLSNVVAISEVGLLSELRPVQFIEKRVKEAKKLGFKNIITSQKFMTLNEVIRSLN